jgi:hypothetical protein
MDNAEPNQLRTIQQYPLKRVTFPQYRIDAVGKQVEDTRAADLGTSQEPF